MEPETNPGLNVLSLNADAPLCHLSSNIIVIINMVKGDIFEIDYIHCIHGVIKS
jgi:hypothetical protein